MRPEAIIFDCDGVLVDSELVGLEDCTEYLSTKGITLSTRDYIRRFTGMRVDQFATELLEHYAQALGRSPTPEESDDLIEGFTATRRAKRHEVAAVPGAKEMLEVATTLGVSLGVASSSAKPYLFAKLQRFGLDQYFDGHIYSADDVPLGKPAPDIFLHAAQNLGIPPAKCLIIEDSPHGVTAGVASGAKVWGFVGGGHCLEDHEARLLAVGAEKVTADHMELLQSLQNIY